MKSTSPSMPPNELDNNEAAEKELCIIWSIDKQLSLITQHYLNKTIILPYFSTVS